MLDLTNKALPETVTVNGKAFLLNTDFRVWMRFMIEFQKMAPEDKINVTYLFKEEYPVHINMAPLLSFAKPKNELPRQIGHNSAIVLDYELDGDLIYSAFLGQYGIDLIDIEHLHWHKFLALLNGLNSSTKLREVMGYRCYEKNNDKNHDVYEDLKYAWSIERMSEEEQASLDAFNEAFTCGEGEN